MGERYIQTPEELEKHLANQVQALKLSAGSFDDGNEFEAQRLAMSIRVLVHDTRNSRSLLGQMGKKGIQFYDTARVVLPDNPLTQNGITALLLTPEGSTRYHAPLDNVPPPGPIWLEFDEWWDKVIFVDKYKRQITRRQVVLSVADTDGGGHVDPTLDPTYADLSRNNSLNWVSRSARGIHAVEGAELAAVRQIAHEVLKSIDPSMERMEQELPEKAALFMGAELIVEEAPYSHPTVLKVGRNALCPCGSGKKYKKCALA